MEENGLGAFEAASKCIVENRVHHHIDHGFTHRFDSVLLMGGYIGARRRISPWW